MLSDEEVMDAFQSAPDGIAGLRAVEAAVRADMQRDVEWEYGVEYTEPLNGDRETVLFRSLDEAQSFIQGDTTSGCYGHRLLGMRPRPAKPKPWLPVTPSTPNQQGAEQ